MPRRYNREESIHKWEDSTVPIASDRDSIQWMKSQARKESKSYGEWCVSNGIMSEYGEKLANREIPESQIGPAGIEIMDRRFSLEDYDDKTPGGPQVASLLVDFSRTKFKHMKERGRPRKKFKKVEDNGES